MSFDAGRIEATSHLDNTPFRQGLVELRRLGKEAEKPVNVPVHADTGEAEGKLLRFEERLRRISGEDVTPNVDVQGLARANTELSLLEARLSRLSRGGGGFSGGAGGGGGFLGALSAAGNHAPRMTTLALGAAAPLVAPAAGLLAGAGASFLTPTLAGGIGAGIFGAAAKSSIGTVNKDLEQLNKLTARYNAATTNKQRAAVLKQEAALWKSLDPEQRKAVRNVEGLEESWKRFQKRLEPQSFTALAGASQLANTGLKYLLPTAQAVGDEIAILEDKAKAAFTAPFWKQFFGDFLPGEAARSIDTFGTAFGHLLSGGAHLMQDFAPLGHDLEDVIVRLTSKFDTWSQGQGPVRFVNWVEKNGPQAAKALDGLAHGLVGVGKGLGPIASVELKALTPVLNFIGDLGDEHPAVITALGGALLAVGGGLKAIQAAKGIGGVASTIRGLLGGGGGAGGRGGTPANPLYVWDVNKTGGSHVPVGAKTAGEEAGGRAGKSAGIRIAEKLGLRGTAAVAVGTALTLAGPITDVAATAKGDSAPLPPLGSRKGAAAQLLATLDPRGRKDFPSYLYPGNNLNIPDAAGYLAQTGSPAQVARLQALSKVYPQIAQGIKAASVSERTLNQYLAVNTGLAGAAAAADAHQAAAIRKAFAGIPQYIKAAQQAASSGGFMIGKNLADGITVGIEDGSGKINVASYKVVHGALKVMRDVPIIRSPSQVTTGYGRMIAEGLAVGFAAQMPQVEALFAKHTAGALSKIRTMAQSRLDSARQQLSTDQQTRTGYIDNLTGTLMPGVTGAFNTQGGVDSISGFFGGVAGTDSRLLRDLGILRKRRLALPIWQQIAEAGPTQGLNLAESILLGNSGSIASINHNYAAASGTARQLASLVGNTVYGPTIARDQDLVNALQALVKELRAHPDVVVKINDREIARAARSGAARNARR